MDNIDIQFGTDGWRGTIAEGFTFDKLALVGSAISVYLSEQGLAGNPLIIGYDNRFLAGSFAAHLATHISSLGQNTILCEAPCPTPVVAFGVTHLNAGGAVMLTASHNPYYFQGLKFIPDFAGPAMPETTDRITELISEIAPGFCAPKLTMVWNGETIDLKQAYFDHLDTITNQHSLSSSNTKVLYCPMHGLGTGYLDEYLRRSGVEVVTINGERDVYFGGRLPDPSPANLGALMPQLVEHGCDLLIATDGDADRFCMLDSTGQIFGANRCLPLLAEFLITYKNLRGDLVRSVATSHLLDGVAAQHGLELVETKVGFKYVGDKLRQGALIGGEESGGISIKGHMPEKDGILASILMLELSATTGESFDSLLADLMKRVGFREYIRVDQSLSAEHRQSIFENLGRFTAQDFAGRNIAKRLDTDGVKFVFEDNSWVMFRQSGTEPVVRTYIEETTPGAMPRFKEKVLAQLASFTPGA